MKIKFLGAAGTVTGSSYVLTSGSGQSLLIDLGMFQGTPNIEDLNYEPYDYDCSTLIGAVLTHAHLDHCGRLPILLAKGFTGDIWMTPPTRDLTELSLFDAAKIAKQDEKQFLFDKDGVEKTIERFKTVEYHTLFQVGDFTVTMRDAGHIMGSASLEIEDARPDSEIHKVVFSGDLGNSPEDLVQATELMDSADAVVIESTYGDSVHSKSDPVEIVQSEINEIEKSGGSGENDGRVLLIPAFSLERTQELLHMMMHLKKTGKILADTPVFLDSPMAEKATGIYLNYTANFNVHIQDDLKVGNPFDFPGLEVVLSREQSEAIHFRPGPKVIIAGGGMMTGGRILGHAAKYLPLNSTRLLIVGYQGDGTLGRKILEGSKKITINKQLISVNANINSTQDMSSHADQQQLLSWLGHIKNVKKVFITHGENTARSVLAKKIAADLKINDITLPVLNQEVVM